MKKLLKSFALGFVVAGLSATSAHATLISSGSNNPLAFNWSFSSVAGALTGNGSLTLSGFNSSSLTVAITLNNTSGLASNRLTSFGFGIDPNATGIGFVDAADGGMVDAVLNTGGNTHIPSLTGIDVCAFGGNNCAGGSNGGINGGGADSFSIVLAGTWGNSVDIAPIGFKYQTGSGSFEFTTCTSNCGGTPPNAIPEPSPLLLLALAMAGLSFVRRRA